MYNPNTSFFRIIKLIFVNIMLIIFILTLSELYLFANKIKERENKDRQIAISRNESFEINYFDFKRFYRILSDKYMNLNKIQIDTDSFRKQTNEDKYNQNKPAIILLGCSFVYGEGLKDEELFSTLLNKYTKRTIYNLAIGGHSQKSSLYVMREYFNEINQKILNYNNNIDYVIYVYMRDHLRRLYVNVHEQRVPDYQIYKQNNQVHLKFKRPSWRNAYVNTCLYNEIMKIKYKNKENNNFDELFKLFCLYMTEINKEVKIKFKKQEKPAQFVVLVYDETGKENWDILREQGIKVIKINDILGFDINSSEYKFLDGHPNPKAWEVITPQIIKELNL